MLRKLLQKNLLAVILLLFVTSFFTLPSTVYGQVTEAQCTNPPHNGTWQSSGSILSGTNSARCILPDGSALVGVTAATVDPTVTASDDPGICGIWPIGKVMCGIASTIIMLPLYFSGYILAIAGLLLNWIISTTVTGMSQMVNGITGINIAWSMIRDLVNISFIFILLYAAINLIIGRGGDMKKTIAGVVIAAILINFSLFFAKAIIDTSNIVALTFYNATISSCDPNGQSQLSECFTNPLGIATVFDSETNPDFLKGLGYNFSKLILVSLGGSIFILITAFVFLAVALMFVVRFITIIFLFIFSPLAVLGGLIPKLNEHTNRWWKDITEQALFAPVFMIMVWVVLSILTSPNFLNPPNQSIANSFAGDFKNSIPLLFNFVIAIALIIGTLTISKSFSKAGGKMGGQFAGAVLGGAAGFAGRQTFGRASRAISNNDKLKEKASEKGMAGTAARLALRGSRKGAESSFDMRATKTGGFFADQLGGAGKAGGKGGFAKQAEEKIKAEKKFAESLKMSDLEKERKTAPLKEELERVKKIDINDQTFKDEHQKEKEAKEEALERARENERIAREKMLHAPADRDLYDAEWKNIDEAVKAAESETEKAETALGAVAKIDDYKNYKISSTQTKLDEIEGLDEDKAIKREVDRLIATKEESDPKKARKIAQEKLAKKEIRTIDSADARRQKQYAETRESALPISTKRVGLVGKISREMQESAIAIRKQSKGKKPEQEIIEKIKKLSEDEKTDQEKPKDEPATPASGGAPTTPPTP